MLYLYNMLLQNLFTFNLLQFKNRTGIYFIKIGSNTYVGSSIDLYSRLTGHRNGLKLKEKSRSSNKILQSAFKKYGEKDTFFKILEFCNIDNLLEREKYHIDIVDPSCNFKLDPVTQQNCISQSKAVYQFDLDGNFIQEFPSTNEAARYLGVSSASIAAVCRKEHGHKSIKEYQWSYNNEVNKYINNSKLAKVKSITIIDNNVEQCFISIADCARYLIKNYGLLYKDFDSLCACITAKRDNKLKNFKYTNIIFVGS